MEFRKLRADEIEVRVSTLTDSGASLLLYKDARTDQNILDETVGAENWQRTHEVVNGNLFCNVGIRIKREDGYEWVWKQDVGTESNTEKEKGQASDSFKRACVNWGIGRELYTAPFIWVNAKEGVTITEKNGKRTTRDRFYVKEISYENGEIASLKIANEKTGKVVFPTSKKQAEEPKKETKTTEKHCITADKVDALKKRCENDGVSIEKLCEICKVEKLEDLTETLHSNINAHWDDVKAKAAA